MHKGSSATNRHTNTQAQRNTQAHEHTLSHTQAHTYYNNNNRWQQLRRRRRRRRQSKGTLRLCRCQVKWQPPPAGRETRPVWAGFSAANRKLKACRTPICVCVCVCASLCVSLLLTRCRMRKSANRMERQAASCQLPTSNCLLPHCGTCCPKEKEREREGKREIEGRCTCPAPLVYRKVHLAGVCFGCCRCCGGMLQMKSSIRVRRLQ